MLLPLKSATKLAETGEGTGGPRGAAAGSSAKIFLRLGGCDCPFATAGEVLEAFAVVGTAFPGAIVLAVVTFLIAA